jgi:soluble lytic murein transglycosylase
LRALSKPLAFLLTALVSLLSVVPTFPNQLDKRLQNLAARAQDRATWPLLRRLAATLPDAERRGRAYLVLGYREYDSGEFEAATGDLRSAAETQFSLADHARYYWGEAAYQAGQSSQAIAALEDFTARFPASTLRVAVVEVLTKSLLQVGQPDRALQILTAEAQVRQRPELAVLLAQAYRDSQKPEGAARIFQDIYYAFPLSSQAEAAREALAQLQTELGAGYPEPSEETQTARADIFAGRSRWQEALDEYAGLLESLPRSPLASRWRLGRARCLIRLGQTDSAIDLLTNGIKPTPDVDPQRLGLLVDAYFRKSDREAAEIVLDQLRKLYPQSLSYATALDAFGNHHVRQGDWTTAARYYQSLAETFHQTAEGREAHWRLMWSYYLDGDLNRAREGFVQHLTRYPGSSHVPGALYWLARIEEQRGATGDAMALYAFLRQRFVQSYYAVQAGRRVRELQESSTGPGNPVPTAPSASELAQRIAPRGAPALRPCETTPPSAELQPFLVLTDLNLPELAVQYATAKLSDSAEAVELRLALSRLFAAQRKPALALFEARRVAPRYMDFELDDLPEEYWLLLYPQEYLSLVKRYARASNLETHLVLGLIRQESAFNPRATSVANARGLMQILPQTVSRNRRGRARAARRLYNPAYNIQFGTRHLRGLLTNLGAVPEQALAAYHAGESRVKSWLSTRTFQEPPEFLETIPIPSTRAYVEAVLRDAGIYRQLLDPSAKYASCRQGPGQRSTPTTAVNFVIGRDEER